MKCQIVGTGTTALQRTKEMYMCIPFEYYIIHMYMYNIQRLSTYQSTILITYNIQYESRTMNIDTELSWTEFKLVNSKVL